MNTTNRSSTEMKEAVKDHIQKDTETDMVVKKQTEEGGNITDAKAQHTELQQLDALAKLILNKLQHHIQTTAMNQSDTMEIINALERQVFLEPKHVRHSQVTKTENDEGSSSTSLFTDEIPQGILASWDGPPLPQILKETLTLSQHPLHGRKLLKPNNARAAWRPSYTLVKQWPTDAPRIQKTWRQNLRISSHSGVRSVLT